MSNIMNGTAAQQSAVAARGNVLVMAGAGTGKTRTLVERCVNCLCDPAQPASLDELLIVTFTDAAATEVRQRIREELEKRASQSDAMHWPAQLALFDIAPIGTLHSFCFKLVQQHFHELGLDPQLTVLDEGQARLMANETLAAVLQEHYATRSAASEAVRRLIQTQAGGQDKVVRTLVLRLHHHAQTRPHPGAWFADQVDLFASPEPAVWREWLREGIADWRSRWTPILAAWAALGNGKAASCREMVERLPEKFSRDQAAEIFARLRPASEDWPHGKKSAWGPPLTKFFEEAAFLGSLSALPAPPAGSVAETKRETLVKHLPKAASAGTAVGEAGPTILTDPLVEDWNWTRGPMTTLLHLAQEFSDRFSETKREAGVVDFHDLEQFALQLLWNFSANQPTAIAHRLRGKIRFVFVDEYQDINAAQDRILAALSRDSSFGVPPSGGAGEKPPEGGTPSPGNRFLVGDVKQSIYRFRHADPQIFRNYAAHWRDGRGTTIPLSENFRSREGILQFVNSVFALLMREEIGGVAYDEAARLGFGAPAERQAFRAAAEAEPRVELVLRLKGGNPSADEADEAAADALAELEDAEKEARLVALRLRELQRTGHTIWDKEEKEFRPVAWRDMAVLLRAPANKAEGYAKEFAKLGVPLIVGRGGFFQSPEIGDLLSVLRVLDNPVQDLPLLATLRSPLVGLSLDDLAAIRLAAHGPFWTALNEAHARCQVAGKGTTASKVGLFLNRFARWRKLARLASLSRCLETVLAETHYADWLRGRQQGEQRHANVQKLLGLVQHFDQFQRQGLFRFLRYIEAQEEAETEPEVAPLPEHDAVQLLSIHQSKGLEFPVVVVADLGKAFNEQDLRAGIILDEVHGLCPQIKPPHSGRSYPSLPWWLAQLRQRRELRGEELRLLYVAMTRARDTLILTGSLSAKKWESQWSRPAGPDDLTAQSILTAQSYADWLGLWFARHAEAPYLRWSLQDDRRLVAPLEAGQNETARGLETVVLDAAVERKLRSVLAWTYPFGDATRRTAKTSVTALRRQAAEHDEEAQPLATSSFSSSSSLSTDLRRRGRERGGLQSKLAAADIGLAHHKFLEHVAIEKALDVGALQSEAQRLERERVLSPEETAALDFNALAAFWETEIGRKVRTAAPHVRRELAFTARFSPQELAAITGEECNPGLEGEFVVVQGVADLVVFLPREIWLVDFKTDEVEADELTAKARHYEPQLKLYAHALSRIYERQVTECWLQFLARQKLVRINV